MDTALETRLRALDEQIKGEIDPVLFTFLNKP